MKFLRLLVVTAGLVAGCTEADPPSLAEAPPVAAATSSGPGVRHDLYSHCGVHSITIDGVLWLATPPLVDDSHNPPPGWSENETPGVFSRSGATTAVFTADSGVQATFRLAAPGEVDRGRGCE